MIAGLFVVAAATGAATRFLAADRFNRVFPSGTLAVNIVASFALGWLSTRGPEWDLVVGIGGLGALSTWSEVANEVAHLARNRQGPLAVLYLMATTTSGVMAAWTGLQVAALG